MSLTLKTLNISKRYLNAEWKGYITIYGVYRSGYAEARPPTGSDIGTYRGLREYIAVFPETEDIPKQGELFELTDGIRKLSDELKKTGEEVWDEAEYDLLLLFPTATVYLMSKISDDKYRERYGEQVEGHESFFIE